MRLHKQESFDIAAVIKTKQQKWNNDTRLLGHLFDKVQRHYLKNYSPYESFQNLFNKGKYNCLTGTMLFALFLSELNYDFEIIETNYHIYLLISTPSKRFVIESTDPYAGFIYDEQQIEEYIARIHKEEKERLTKSASFTYQEDHNVSYNELIGIQYYNRAVTAYIAEDYELALSQLDLAVQYYPSVRAKEFFVYLLSDIKNKKVLPGFQENKYSNLQRLAML